MKIVRTCTELVEYNEVDILGVLYRRYSSDNWVTLSHSIWSRVGGNELIRLESDFNELVRSMARGSGKTIANIAKMTPPLTQGMMELSFVQKKVNEWVVRMHKHGEDTFIGRLLENEVTKDWFFLAGSTHNLLFSYHLDVISIKLKELNKISSDRGATNGH